MLEGGKEADRRRHPRLPMSVEVELYRPGQPTLAIETEDLSGGGVFLVMDAADRPSLGERVRLRLVGTLGAGETPPIVDAVVVRHSEKGVAVEFSEG